MGHPNEQSKTLVEAKWFCWIALGARNGWISECQHLSSSHWCNWHRTSTPGKSFKQMEERALLAKMAKKALPLPRFHLLQQTLCQKCILFVKIYPTSSRVANGVAFVWTRGVVGAHMMWAHDGWGVGGLRWWCTLRLRGPGRVSYCLSPPDPRPPHWTQSTQPGRSGRCSLAVRSAQTFILHSCLLIFLWNSGNQGPNWKQNFDFMKFLSLLICQVIPKLTMSRLGNRLSVWLLNWMIKKIVHSWQIPGLKFWTRH